MYEKNSITLLILITDKQRRAEKRFVVLMEKLRGKGVAVMNMMMVMLIMCTVSVSLMMTAMIHCVDAASKKPEVYKVGGTDIHGWRPLFDYTTWSREHNFYVGDSLDFSYDKTFYNVLEVNKNAYETCSADHPIAMISGGHGHDVFNLTSAKSFYFLSDRGYCFEGMRLAVKVLYTTASEPKPDSSPLPYIASTSDSGRNVIPTVTGAIVLAWTLLLNV